MKKILMMGLLLVGSGLVWAECEPVKHGLGVNIELASSLGLAPLGDDTTSLATAMGLGSMAVGINLSYQLRISELFSLSPEVGFLYNNRAKDSISYLMARWHEVSFNLVPRFHFGYFYVGVGAGIRLHTAPQFSTMTGYLNSTTGDLGDNLKDLGIKTKTSARFNVLLDLGAAIPVSEQFDVTVGFKLTVAPVAIDKLINFSCGTDIMNKSTSLAQAAVYVGMITYF